MIKLLISLLLCVSVPALAANDLLQKQGRTDEIKDKTAGAETTKPLIFKNELEFENKFDQKQELGEKLACEAGLTLDYSQRETHLEVEALLSNYTCASSRGGYQIVVDYLDVNGEQAIFESQEKWQKNSNDDFRTTHKYPFDFDAEIRKVRGVLSPNDGCWCLPVAE